MTEHSRENPEAQKHRERQATWDRALARLEGVEDALGRPVDEGIRDAIVAFEVNGFHSNGSCEGHVREQFGSIVKLCPYVSLGVDQPDMRFVGEEEIRKAIMEKYNVSSIREIYGTKEALDDYWGCICQGDMQETEAFLEVRAQNDECARLILELLGEFYADRPHSEETGLVVVRVGSFVRVTTPKWLIKQQPQEEIEIAACQAELEKEQEEMRAFTEFMKKRFFNS